MPVSKSAKTPLMAMLRLAFRNAHSTPGAEPFPVTNFERREFLKSAAILGAGTLLSSCRKSDSTAKSAPRIAIIGAGIAGLCAAHHLSKAGIRATVYEAGARAGGRIFTFRNLVGPGLFTEAGGEFIDSTHADLIGLARELGLVLADHRSTAFSGFRANAWRFGGRHYTDTEVLAEVKLAAESLQADVDGLPEEIVAGTGGLAADLDRLSLDEYLEKRGVTDWFGALLKTAYVGEFGLDAGEQSALNLLTMVSLDTSTSEFAIYGESDERFRVEGGNQKITDGLAQRLEPQLRFGHRLEALSGTSGNYRLTFKGPSGVIVQTADVVILALPFTLLRQVELRLELPEIKRRAIAELGMGTNSKLFLGYDSRPWRKNGYLGNFFTDGSLQCGWDHTQTQSGETGGLTLFQGGGKGLALGSGSPADQARNFSTEIEALYPGSNAAHNGKSGGFHWPAYPLSLGSYACYKPGQWTGFGGEEGRPIGDLYFAGDHCSGDFQGYMNGGAETGRKAAEAILAKWGISG